MEVDCQYRVRASYVLYFIVLEYLYHSPGHCDVLWTWTSITAETPADDIDARLKKMGLDPEKERSWEDRVLFIGQIADMSASLSERQMHVESKSCDARRV